MSGIHFSILRKVLLEKKRKLVFHLINTDNLKQVAMCYNERHAGETVGSKSLTLSRPKSPQLNLMGNAATLHAVPAARSTVLRQSNENIFLFFLWCRFAPHGRAKTMHYFTQCVPHYRVVQLRLETIIPEPVTIIQNRLKRPSRASEHEWQ